MHDSAYDGESLAEFDHRLARAQPQSRPGCLRVKRAALLQLHEPEATEVAISMLSRVVDEYDHFLEVPWCHELLGDAHRRRGDLRQAEHHLRRCLETADQRRNGTTKVTELSLAEVLLEQGRIEEAGEMLAAQDVRGLGWNSQIFRFAVAWARYEDAIGGDPGPWGDEGPRTGRGPGSTAAPASGPGVVDADHQTIRQMRCLAEPT